MFNVMCQWCGDYFPTRDRGVLTCSAVCALEYFDHCGQVARKRQERQQREAGKRPDGAPFVDPERT